MSLLFWRKKSAAQIRKDSLQAEFEATKGVVSPGVGVEHDQPVKAAAATAVKKDGMMEATAQRERVRLKRVYDSLLPCERDGAKRLALRLGELNCEVLDEKYPRLDLSFLNWRRKADGWPVFAVYDPESPVCVLQVSFSEWGSMRTSRFPSEAPGDYSDVFRKIEATMRLEGTTMFDTQTMRSTFKGIIPDATRSLIKQAVASKEFQYVFIVGEAVWERIDSRENWDPLVMGVAEGKGWLLDTFDLTPIERIVKAEFSGSPPEDWER